MVESLRIRNPGPNLRIRDLIFQFECLSCKKVYEKSLNYYPGTCSNCNKQFLKACRTVESRLDVPKSNQHLFLCLFTYHPGAPYSFTVLSITVESLLQDGEFRKVNVWDRKAVPSRTSFINLEDGLYFIGGLKPDTDPRKYGWDCRSSEFLFLSYDELLRDPSTAVLSSHPSHIEDMISGKSSAITVKVGESLYVLAGPPFVSVIPYPTFEKYDLHLKKWFPLPGPPMLDRNSQFFPGGAYEKFSYVVIGKRFYVSSREYSSVYDTESVNPKWEPCWLFLGFESCTKWENSKPHGKWETVKCGPPFPFVGGAIMYGNDTLICCSSRMVVAFEMVKERVVRKQKLNDLSYCTSPMLVDLGSGCFCTVCHVRELAVDEDKLSVVVFKVSKVLEREGANGNFLKCELLRRVMRGTSDLGRCIPLSSFACFWNMSDDVGSASFDLMEADATGPSCSSNREQCEVVDVAEQMRKRKHTA